MKDKIKINSYTGFQKLKSCIVGKSYPPEFYDKISNKQVRQVMQKIAVETEEDYQSFIKLIESFDVKVYRPEIKTDNNFEEYRLILNNGAHWYQPPPMNPRDNLLVQSDRIFVDRPCGEHYVDFFDNIIDQIDGKIYHSGQSDNVVLKNCSMPSITRVGKSIFFDGFKNVELLINKFFNEYDCKVIDTGGHSDGVFCPVTPGLIISLYDVPTYADTFPDWEVVYLPDQSWDKVKSFLELKKKNNGKWWIPDQIITNDLVDFVETWLNDWVGYVEETVFDVNMFVIDEQNVVCNNYNEKVFSALEKYGVTPHICNFRHRYFWDGGLHCITLDLEREGGPENYV